MTDTSDINRMRWASRRGLLELDLFLAQFVDQRYGGLSPDLQSMYRELLEAPDQDLLEWLMGRSAPEPAHLSVIVDLIRQHKADQAPTPS
jgi:antitoxin CptB